MVALNDSFIMLVEVDLVPDYNRDEVIDQTYRNKATASNPFRFWVNDDNDTGEVHNDDVPQQGNDADANDAFVGRVYGMRNLVHFFPVFINLMSVLTSIDDHS